MGWMLKEVSERANEHFKDKGKAQIAMRVVDGPQFAKYENVVVEWVDEVKDKTIDEKTVRNLMRNVNKNAKKLDQIIPKLDQIFKPLQNLQILSILNTALSAANLVATVAGMIIICDKLNGIDRKLDQIQKEIADLKDINFELQIYKPCRKLVDDYKMLTPDLTKGKFIPEEKLITLIRECKDYIISIYNLQARKILPMDVALNLIFDLLPIFANCLMVYYGYTESDEISLLFHPEDNTFGRKVRKINTSLAGEASAVFSLALGKIATFDCRVIPLPNKERVADYFIWRQEDSHRNSLNAHCYWALRREGMNARKATSVLEGMSVPDKNELLFERGINYNDLPNWQKRGVGIAFADVEKEGFNPVKKENVKTVRRELAVNYDLPLGEEYRKYILQLLTDASESQSL